MKRIAIIVIALALVCSSVFAVDFSLGVMQNYLNTSIIADAEMGRFGVEGALGFPLVLAGVEVFDYYMWQNKAGDAPNPLEALFIPSVMVNGYWKAIDSKVFDLRLGVQGDVMAIIESEDLAAVGLWGLSLGLDFRFNDRFSMNLTGAIPAGFLASSFGDALDRFTVFYGSTSDDGIDGMIALPVIINEFARLSLKWSL